MKKFLVIILASLMIFVFAGCSNEANDKLTENDKGSTQSDDESNIEVIGRANTPDSLPDDLNFGGTTINIYHFGNALTKDYDAGGEMGGEIVLDAVYQRNRKTEERLNINLNWIAGSDDWDGFPTQVRTALLAGTGEYDLIMEENSRAFQHSLQGFFVNLIDAPHIDLDQPWWYSTMMEEGSIDNNKRYYITGDMTMTTLLGASAVFFNKGIYTNYFGNVDDIYNHVLNGTWTHDTLAEYCKGVYTDLNGNQEADEGDLFGFEYEQWGIPNYLSMSTGLKYSTRDTDGLPVLDIYNENSILWGETLYKLLYTDNISRLGDKSKSFINEKNLFYIGQFDSATQIRAASFEYGILPYPKLTESLDYMSGAATANGNGVAIPVSAPSDKFEATCATVESLSAEAYRHVVPTWYETALKIKYLASEIDAQMVDIIYDHISSPFIMMADKEMTIGSIFTYAVFGSTNNGAFSSYYEKNEGAIKSKWDKMIQQYLALED